MAFIFVPNADGSFTEGDKQTNPDTGVEYIYVDGAWRALGPKIEDEFDTLDERYIKLQGRSDVGDTYTIKGPGESGGTSTFHQIKDGKQYLYHIDTPQDSNTEWVANVSYVKSKTDDKMSKQGTQTVNSGHWKIIQPNQDGNNRTFVDIYDGEINLYNVADPTDGADGWATNKKYVKDNFIGNKGTQTLDADSWNIRQPDANEANKNFISIHNGEMHLYHVADPTDGDNAWAANKKYVNDVAAEYLPLAGGNLTGDVESAGKFTLNHGSGGPKERKFLIKGETADGVDGDLFYSYKNDDGSLDAVNYKGKMTVDSNIVTKKFVDDAIAGIGGGVPVGSIMIWMNSSAPAGWFKLQGGTFDINQYPQLHAYLERTAGYSSGRLPSWGGHYPGEYGDHMADPLGTKVGHRTARPAGEAPYHPNPIPNGNTRTFNATGGTNAYSNGTARPAITEGWDNTTRPKTVVVHYIIKHD